MMYWPRVEVDGGPTIAQHQVNVLMLVISILLYCEKVQHVKPNNSTGDLNPCPDLKYSIKFRHIFRAVAVMAADGACNIP